jgi:hypothetical protein
MLLTLFALSEAYEDSIYDLFPPIQETSPSETGDWSFVGLQQI